MIEVDEKLKKLCQKDGVPKRIRITFPNEDFRTLTNADVVAESMRFTENLCSATTFKFGLCEANVFEIKTLYVKEVLRGKVIRPFIDYYDKDEDKWYEMPLGEFIVDSHKRDGATPVKTLIAYGREADLNPTADLYRLYNDVNWLSPGYAPMYAEYVIIPSTFRKERCNWFDWQESTYLDEWVERPYQSASWQRHDVVTIYGHSYDAFYQRNINHEWHIWINAGRKVITPNAKANVISMYFSESKIDNDAIQRVLNRIYQNVDNIIQSFYDHKADSIEYSMTNKDIIDLITHSHWKEKDSMQRYMRELSGYQLVEGLDTSGYYGDIFAYPVVRSFGWKRTDFYVNPSGSQTIVGQDEGEWGIDFDGYGIKTVECVKDIQIDRADETNMIANPDFVVLGRRTRPTWLDSKEEYRKFIEDFFELYASFGRTNRYGQFERLEIDSKFAEYASEKTKAGQVTVSNGKNNYIIDTNARAGAYFEDYVVEKIGTVLFDWSQTIGGQKVTQTYEMKISDAPNTYYIQDNYHLNYATNTWFLTNRVIRNCFIPRLKNITWRPMNIFTPALPFVECGDIIRVDVGGEKMDTFIHTRTMQGLQMLTDNFVSDMSEVVSYDDVDIAKSIVIDT